MEITVIGYHPHGSTHLGITMVLYHFPTHHTAINPFAYMTPTTLYTPPHCFQLDVYAPDPHQENYHSKKPYVVKFLNNRIKKCRGCSGTFAHKADGSLPDPPREE